jgi:hypothetical protein
MSEPILTRSLWPVSEPKQPRDPVAVQLERLLEGLRPGQEKARFAGWGREMRSLYGRVDPPVLRGAVTRYLALETDLPQPAAFAPYVVLAEEAIARKARAATPRLEAPPPPTAEEQRTREAREAREREAIEAARATLPAHLRKPRRGRS